MTNEKFSKAAREALLPEYEADMSEKSEHIFSEKFEAEMQSLIKCRKKHRFVDTKGKKIAFVSAIVATAACIGLLIIPSEKISDEKTDNSFPVMYAEDGKIKYTYVDYDDGGTV